MGWSRKLEPRGFKPRSVCTHLPNVSIDLSYCEDLLSGKGRRERGREERGGKKGREREKNRRTDSKMEPCKLLCSERQQGNGEPLICKGQPVPG